MKTSKKLMSLALVLVMMLMMVPFTVSAATTVPEGPYTATLTCAPNAQTEKDKVGNYTFSLYKIADMNTTTGQYTVISSLADNAEIVSAINAENKATKSKTIITACDKVFKQDKSKFGTAAKEANFTETQTQQTVTVNDAGLYYVACTSKPTKVTSVTNSLFSLPFFNGVNWIKENTTVNLATKISTSPVEVEKVADKEYVSDLDKTVTYTITASTVGDLVENQMTKYAVVDMMGKGLTFNEDSVVVKLDNTKTLVKDTDYTIVQNYSSNKVTNATFAVVLTDTALKSAEFYNANKVVVTFTADVNKDAEIGSAIPNTPAEEYGNKSGSDYQEGPVVNVYTYGMSIKKVDGNTSKPLSGAVFTIFTDADATTPLVVNGKKIIATTLEDGTANFAMQDATYDFKFDPDTTYYVKETKAPQNYNLNSTVFTVNIDKTKKFTVVNDTVVADYPLDVPSTGGMGTIMFTISGATLIACAGVLLVVLFKKKKTNTK